MAKRLQAIRGMSDILPENIGHWQQIESVLRDIISRYGYQEIRMPIVESTDLFKRSIGEVTDIVEKEMYTFEDRNGDQLSLRPEGTAGCLRAGIEHGLFYNQIQRLWYQGPMFRHERPQKGRYRQFHQVGVEALGMAGPDIDAELILMTARFWKTLGLSDQLTLQINSLGTSEARKAYRAKLVSYLEKNADVLDDDCKRRLSTNPLRILDSKNPEMKACIEGAPKMIDHLDEASQKHFAQLCKLLDAADIKYEVNPFLVRGLDYYSQTVFEWVTSRLGAQGTVCAGGRYDTLVEMLGGKATPAIGFALGLERLVLLYEQTAQAQAQAALTSLDAYLILVGEQAQEQGLALAEHLRNEVPGCQLVMNCGGGSYKSQFKRADKSGAKLALILGEDELVAKTIGLKYLRSDRPQASVTENELIAILQSGEI